MWIEHIFNFIVRKQRQQQAKWNWSAGLKTPSCCATIRYIKIRTNFTERKNPCCSLSTLDIYWPLCHLISIQKIKRIMPSIIAQKTMFIPRETQTVTGVLFRQCLKLQFHLVEHLEKRFLNTGHFNWNKCQFFYVTGSRALIKYCRTFHKSVQLSDQVWIIDTLALL